ncbi:MAG: hypothetical protein ACOX7U_07570 [Desulfitobacteriia bacterium]
MSKGSGNKLVGRSRRPLSPRVKKKLDYKTTNNKVQVLSNQRTDAPDNKEPDIENCK